MRIPAHQIENDLTVTITGDEPWLVPIVASLSDIDRESKTPPRITGTIKLRKDTAGFVHGKGVLKHSPSLVCGRCDDVLAWPIQADVNVSWRPAFESNAPHEINLTAEDLDVYFIEDGAIDLSQLVNDCLHLAIPSHVPVRTPDSEDCLTCGLSLANTLVYGDGVSLPPKASPFEGLKDLKL